jgi:hypothetical protein
MAFKVETDEQRRLIYVVFLGVVDNAELVALEAQLRRTAAYQSGADVLVDCTGISDLLVTDRGLYGLAKQTEQNRNLLAIVTRPGFLYGMARMYEIMANWEIERVHVFVDRSAAMEWIKDRRLAADSASLHPTCQILR